MHKKIFIENLICNASVGVYEEEKKNKQKIIINLEILLIKNIKTNSDNLDDVADYGKFRRTILNVVNTKHYNLIETLAETLIINCKRLDKVKYIKIKITKPNAFDDCNVAYEISNYP
tara:strand:- start:3051 stop:3401 length:351 start_codon:yes stop_codon:yes gene_type:complete